MILVMDSYRVLFVCKANICRSPIAEGVMRAYLCRACIDDYVVVDSAATHPFCEGAPPADKAQVAALRRKYDISSQRARLVRQADFARADLILAMDFDVLESLKAQCPAVHGHKIQLLMPYAPNINALVVHDPFGRSMRDFERVVDYIEDACDGVLAYVMSRLGMVNSSSAQLNAARPN